MHLFHMSKAEYLEATPGEIYDLVACWGVFEGHLKEVHKKPMDYDDALKALNA